MIKVGLTGGIGSGKSVVANLFADLGIPIYNSDERAKKMMSNDEELKSSIISIFGDQAYSYDKLDRKYLASKVFNNRELLNKLNAVVHPAVRSDYNKWAEDQTTHYSIREAAILFESGSYKDCDVISLVSAPEELRIRRVTERDGVTSEEVKARVDNQWTDDKRGELSHYFINKDGYYSLKDQVLKIHESLLNKLE